MSQQSSRGERGGLTRRNFFIATVGGLATTSAFCFHLANPIQAYAGRRRRSRSAKTAPTPEALIADLYASLNRDQYHAVVFPYDDPKRLAVASDWSICGHHIDRIFDQRQQAMIRDIFLGLHAPHYARPVMAQVERDNKQGGFGRCTVALFEHPRVAGCSEFILTGRHVTCRCCVSEGLSTNGGPVLFGGDHPVYRRAMRSANNLFETLARSPGTLDADGVITTDLWADQERMVLRAIVSVLAPLRRKDVRNALWHMRAARGQSMRLKSFGNMPGATENAWQIEGPTLAWYFRSRPHLHTWFELRDGA